AGPVFPTLAGPGIDAWFAGSRDGVRAPDARTGLGVVRIDEAADAGLASADADDDLSIERQRRHRHGMSEPVVGDLRFPALGAGLGIERNQVAVERADVDHVIEDCDTP